MLGNPHSVRGQSLLSLVVGAAVFSLGIVLALPAFVSHRESDIQLQSKIIAEGYASELIEFFRSLSSSQLISLYKNNPWNTAFQPYYLCAHINLLDRKSGIILNPDPLAQLPQSPLDGNSPNSTANRFYRIQVVDLRGSGGNDAVSPDYQYCSGDITKVPALQPYEKFMVSVGVSWIPKGKKDPERVILSTILP